MNINEFDRSANVLEVKDAYAGLGFEPIPLKPNSKVPLGNMSWKRAQFSRLWDGATGDENIGLRCGGRRWFAVIDCDDKNHEGTFNNIVEYLESIGLSINDFPIVMTASGVGRHIYFCLKSRPDANTSQICCDFGSGEIRFGDGAYVAAPYSLINNNTYKFINGDMNSLPEIEYEILFPISDRYKNSPFQKKPKIPRRVWQLLKGERAEKYKSRSEMEQAIVTSLVNAGFDDMGIIRFFESQEPPKFKELLDKNLGSAYTYLGRSIRKARKWTAENESADRIFAHQTVSTAIQMLMPGRTGAVDRAVLIAHAYISYTCGKREYGASFREIADIAGICTSTAMRATHRLIEARFIERVKEARGAFSNVYRLCELQHTLNILSINTVRECVMFINHDIFFEKALGKTGAEIYINLDIQPMTVKEIHLKTGRDRSTITRNLERMSNIKNPDKGNSIDIVRKINQQWHPIRNNLDHAAKALGISGFGLSQKLKHENERKQYASHLENIFGKEEKNDK